MKESSNPKCGNQNCLHTLSQKENLASMTFSADSQRTFELWKRISPGMLPEFSSTPKTTNQLALLDWQADVHSDAIDRRHHLKKTDFGEYCEAALREKNQRKAAMRK